MRRVGVFLIKVPQFNFGCMKVSLDYNVCIMKELPGQLEILPVTAGCDVDGVYSFQVETGSQKLDNQNHADTVYWK